MIIAGLIEATPMRVTGNTGAWPLPAMIIAGLIEAICQPCSPYARMCYRR